VKIPQLETRLEKQRRKNALISSTSNRKKTGQSVLDTQVSERSAMPAETADKHNSMTLTPVRSEKDKTKPKWVGPRKAPANVRSTTVIDYNPSLCKDYNETGFCGYGDSCKFLHDRGDYKGGWQLEKEWEEKKAREKRLLEGEDVSDEEDYTINSDDELPFACHICRDDFKNPVVTKCGHYFCERCALKRYVKYKGCAVCGQPTNGIFKTAHKLVKKLKKQEEAEKALEKGEAGEADKEDDDEEEEDGIIKDVSSGIQGATSTGWAIPGFEGRFKPQKEV